MDKRNTDCPSCMLLTNKEICNSCLPLWHCSNVEAAFLSLEGKPVILNMYSTYIKDMMDYGMLMHMIRGE